MSGLPDCPTCSGKVWLPMLTDIGPNPETYHCPDCVDGKVSIEQLAATWRAVWDDNNIRRGCSCIDRLRAVRP